MSHCNMVECDVSAHHSRHLCQGNVIFHHQHTTRDMTFSLLRIHQGGHSVANYTIKFQKQAGCCGWNTSALMATCVQGLSKTSQESIVPSTKAGLSANYRPDFMSPPRAPEPKRDLGNNMQLGTADHITMSNCHDSCFGCGDLGHTVELFSVKAKMVGSFMAG